MSRPCFICDQEGTVYLTATTWVCADHADGTGKHYMEGNTDDTINPSPNARNMSQAPPQ